MMRRALAVVSALAVPLSISPAQNDQPTPPTVAIISLKHLNALQVAWMFGSEQPPPPLPTEPAPTLDAFADRVREEAIQAAQPAPDTMREAGLYPYAPRETVTLTPAPADRLPAPPKVAPVTGGLSRLLPDDLDGAPVAIPDQNALLVRGTAQAIDEFREIVALLDKPVRRVRLTAALAILSAGAAGPLQSIGTLPGSGTTGPPEAGASASLVLETNRMALVQVGLGVPFVAAPGGEQPDAYRVGAAVDARELLVMARGNADSSISLWAASPEAVGALDWWRQPAGPAGTPPPPPPGVSMVRIEDGGTALFGGFATPGELLAREPGPLHAEGASLDSQAVLLITARLVPIDEARGALPPK